MFQLDIRRWQKNPRRSRSSNRGSCRIEPLETRTLLSETASAQLTLVSTGGTQVSPVYNYSITVTNTGTTNIGTFWFAWQPEQDYLPNIPTAITFPSGWTDSPTGSHNSTDGSAIEWVATTSPITPGQSLGGFNFSSIDSPTVLAGDSPTHAGIPVLTSEIYVGAAFAAGDPGFEFAVTAAPVTTTAASTTTLLSSALTAFAGDPVTLTSTVLSSSGTGATPTGTVDFTQDGNDLGSVAVAGDGTAQLITSALPVGTDHITATYSGDTTYSPSASAAVIETVSPPANAVTTTTVVTSSNLAAVSGAAVTFTATITPSTTGATPTGTVNFTSNGTALGSGRVQTDGTAGLTVTSLPIGGDTIVATYNGDSNYAASTSSSIVETITAPPTLVPAISKTKLAASLVADTAAKGTVTLTITNGTATAVKGKSAITIYASTTGVIDNSSIVLAQVSKNLNVKTTAPQTVTVPLKILSTTIPVGAYTLFARVIDPSSNANDSSAGPALSVTPATIALSETVTKTSIPTSTTSGAKGHGSVVLAILNNGNIATPNTTTAALFATVGGVVDGSAVQIATIIKPLHIKAGKSANVSIPVKLIPTLAVGSYSVVARVTDPNGALTSVAVGTLSITA